MKRSIFTEEEKALLERIGTPRQVLPRGLIYLQGDEADHLYYICSGRVRVFQNTPSGREVTLDVVEAGHIIGESAFTEGQKRPACIQAVNQVQLVSFQMADVLPYFRTEATLALHFLQQCSNTMDRLSNRLHDQCLMDRYGKIASFILDLTAEESEEKGTLDGVLPYTHEDIAESLGLSRTTVTAVLQEFEEQGWVRGGYGQLKVMNRTALEGYLLQKKEM